MDIEPRLTEIRDCLYRVAVKAIIVDDGKVLLVKDAGDENWSFPGGGIDYGEDLKTAAARELSEELGVIPSAISSDFSVITVVIGQINEGIPRCNLFIRVILLDNKLSVDKDHVSEQRWIDINELNNVIFEKSSGNITDVISYIQRLLS